MSTDRKYPPTPPCIAEAISDQLMMSAAYCQSEANAAWRALVDAGQITTGERYGVEVTLFVLELPDA